MPVGIMLVDDSLQLPYQLNLESNFYKLFLIKLPTLNFFPISYLMHTPAPHYQWTIVCKIWEGRKKEMNLCKILEG
jgi:hypothetical protein